MRYFRLITIFSLLLISVLHTYVHSETYIAEQVIVVGSFDEFSKILNDKKFSSRPILICKPIDVTTDITVTNNSIIISDGGCFTSSNNSKINFNSQFLSIKDEIFKGDIEVTFFKGSVERIYPQWFGARSTTEPGFHSYDSGSAIQKAIRASGDEISTIVIPSGVYKITKTIYVDHAKQLLGDGFSTYPGKLDLKNGTILEYYGQDECIHVGGNLQGSDNVGERNQISNIAFVSKKQNQIGLKASYTRYDKFSNLYFSGFEKGFYLGPQSWLCKIELVQCMACKIGLYCDSGGEDSVFTNCLFRGYGLDSIGAVINYHSQTNIFIGCDFSNNNYGLRLNNGEYRGVPLSTHTTVLNCIFENCGTAAIEVDSGSTSKYPKIIIQGCRFIFHDNVGRYLPTRETNSATCILLVKADSALITGNIASGYNNFITIKSSDKVRKIVSFSNDTSGIKSVIYNGSLPQKNRLMFDEDALDISNIKLYNLPTSPDGVNSGEIWVDTNNGNVLRIKP